MSRRSLVPLFFVALVGACASPVVAPPLVPASPPAPSTENPEPCAADDPYRPRPVTSAPSPSLPPLPEVPAIAIKMGADYTVEGAVHHLRSRIHGHDFDKGDVTIVGVIVATNLASAPPCAIHRVSRPNPPGCVAELPSFTIADSASSPVKIRVLGWASSFAVVSEALARDADKKTPLIGPYQDELWAVDVPVPLPSVGAKVRVHGRYGTSFTKSSRGTIVDPDDGIFTATRVDTVTPAPTPARLGR